MITLRTGRITPPGMGQVTRCCACLCNLCVQQVELFECSKVNVSEGFELCQGRLSSVNECLQGSVEILWTFVVVQSCILEHA